METLFPSQKRCCGCEICKSHAEIKAVLQRGDKAEMAKCIEQLSEILCNTAEELDMAKSYIQDLKEGTANGV